MNKFVNQVSFNIPANVNHAVSAFPQEEIAPRAIKVPELIPKTERVHILDELDQHDWKPVSITGMKGNYTPGGRIGSYRLSNYTKKYANVLWERLWKFFDDREFFPYHFPTDIDDHEVWRPVGISPLLRFVRYENNGGLVPHYDAPYVENDHTRTLKSLIIYLDDDPHIDGGETRFLYDSQAATPVPARNLNDGLELLPRDTPQIRHSVKPTPGMGLIFPHRIWHDSAPVIGEGVKTILRTDIMYTKAIK